MKKLLQIGNKQRIEKKGNAVSEAVTECSLVI